MLDLELKFNLAFKYDIECEWDLDWILNLILYLIQISKEILRKLKVSTFLGESLMLGSLFELIFPRLWFNAISQPRIRFHVYFLMSLCIFNLKLWPDKFSEPRLQVVVYFQPKALAWQVLRAKTMARRILPAKVTVCCVLQTQKLRFVSLPRLWVIVYFEPRAWA